MEGSDRSDKKHDEHVNFTYTILDNRSESLEILSTIVPLTPQWISIG